MRAQNVPRQGKATLEWNRETHGKYTQAQASCWNDARFNFELMGLKAGGPRMCHFGMLTV